MVGVQNTFQRPAEPSRIVTAIGNLVVVAFVRQWLLALNDLANNGNVFARSCHWPAKRNTIPALDDAGAGGTESKNKPATR